MFRKPTSAAVTLCQDRRDPTDVARALIFSLLGIGSNTTFRRSESPLAHYLKNRIGPFSPIPEFDAHYYLKIYQDVAAAGVDPFEHFIFHGYKEGRNPSDGFDTKFYIQRYFKGKTDQNPLLHYLEHRDEEGIFPVPPENEATIPAEIRRFTKPSALFEEQRPLPRALSPAPRFWPIT